MRHLCALVSLAAAATAWTAGGAALGRGRCSGPRAAAGDAAEPRNAKKRGRLLAECAEADQGRNVARHATVLAHIESLEASNPTPDPLASPLLGGRWCLIYTTSQAILGSKRLRPFRPRPLIMQHISTKTLRVVNEEWVLGGLLRNVARGNLEPRDDGRTVDVQFTSFGIGWLKVPAPKKARGVLETTYLDEDLRISRGDKGNLFVLVRDGPTTII
ncbi:hypothetical protein M885DRAFT_538080 [Pelagophyceae sp. CCMP2097]|nr:hypothetical protein M885DRAFT_538080 [Pelagophyceae sp. CCMP2097]